MATYASAQSFTNPVYTGAPAAAMATPTPGTVVVRLNGRVRFYAGFASANDAQALSPSLSAAGVAPTAAGSPPRRVSRTSMALPSMAVCIRASTAWPQTA